MVENVVGNMEKILVTGGAGFIGSHLTDALIARRINICVFDNLTAGTLQNIKPWLKDPNFNFIKGDLLNSADLTKIEKPVLNWSFTWPQIPKPERAQPTQIYTSNKTQ